MTRPSQAGAADCYPAIRRTSTMAIGFSDRFDFAKILGWELYRVTIDKYHVMFWFENERALLNIADRFALISSDKTVQFTYEIYGTNKTLNVDRILRARVREVHIVSSDQLDLTFQNGDVLSVYDNPSLRSWWFLGELQGNRWGFEMGDCEPEELTESERAQRSGGATGIKA